MSKGEEGKKITLRLKKPEEKRDNASEHLNNPTYNRTGKAWAKWLCALAFTTMGVDMPLLKVKAALSQVQQVENENLEFNKKTNAAYEAIKKLENYFEDMKKKGMEPRVFSGSPQAKEFMEKLRPYLEAVGLATEGDLSTQIEKLNDRLGVKTYPSYLTEETTKKLREAMVDLNATQEYAFIEKIAGKPSEKTTAQVTVPQPTVQKPAEKEYPPTPELMTKLKEIKKEEKPVVKEEKKIEMTDLQKAEMYKEALESLADAQKYIKPLKVAKPKKPKKKASKEEKAAYEEKLAAYNNYNEQMRLIDETKKRLESITNVIKILELTEKQQKGEKLTKKENEMLKGYDPKILDETFNFIISQLEGIEKQGILSGTPRKDYEKNLDDAKTKRDPAELIKATKLLYNEVYYIIYVNQYYALEQVKEINDARKKYKLNKIAAPAYPNTVAGSYALRNWVYAQENETCADIVRKSADQAKLSSEAINAVKSIGKIRAERATLQESYEKTKSKDDAKKLIDGALEEIELWRKYYKEIGKGDDKSLNKANEKFELAKKYREEVFDKEAPINIHILLPFKIAADALNDLTPEMFKKFAIDTYEKGLEKDPNGWITGVKGSSVVKNVPFIPFYGGDYYKGTPKISGIDPTYGRIENSRSPYGKSGTEPEMFESNYGATVGFAEHYKEEFPGILDNIKKAALNYGAEGDLYEVVEKIATSAKQNVLVNRIGALKAFFESYGKGLAEIEKGVYYVVPLTALNVFDESENAVSKGGKVTTVKPGITLKAVQLAKLFYEAASLVDGKEKYDALDVDKAFEKGQQLLQFLKGLPENLKKKPEIKKAMEDLQNKDKISYIRALLALQSVSEFGLASIYRFEPSTESKRFFRAADINDRVLELPLIDSQRVALAEIAIEDAKLATIALKAGQLTIYVPKSVQEIKEQPDVLKIVDITQLNELSPTTTIIKGGGDTYLRGPGEVLGLAAELPSYFGNDEQKAMEYVSMVMDDLNYINQPDTNPSETQKRAEMLAKFLEENYGKDKKNIQDALDALNSGNLEEGLKKLRDSGAAGFEEILKNMGRIYVVDIDEKGVHTYGMGVDLRFLPGSGYEEVWKALRGDEKLKNVVLSQIDLFYRWQMANLPVNFTEGRINPETLEFELANVYPGEGTFSKHTAGLGLTGAWGLPSTKAFGNVMEGTFTMALSIADADIHTKEPVEIEVGAEGEKKTEKKTISIKGRQISLSILDLTLSFPGAAGPVRLENIGLGFVNIPLYRDEKMGKFKWSAGANPLFHTVVTVPLYEKKTEEGLPAFFEKGYQQVAIYVAPQLLIYMKDPTLFIDGGLRYGYSSGKTALQIQIGTSVVYSFTGEVTKGKNVKWDAVKGNVGVEIIPGVELNVQGSYSPTNNNWGVSGGIEIIPEKFKKK